MITPLDTSEYRRVLAIDTQVVLEAKPLDQLPWSELGDGPLLLLVLRQVQSEIDAKKNDGRLGKRARAFNKRLEPFLEARVPVQLITGPAKVDVALVANSRIDWAALDDLDRDDGDDRIVAQALHALVDDPKRIEVLSHDLRPRDAAITHGLKALKLPETWLREPDPSPLDREIARLEREVRVLRTEQPEIDVRVEAITPAPWKNVTVEAASEEQADRIKIAVMRTAPSVQRNDPFGFTSPLDSDYSFPDRLKKWRDKLNSVVLPAMHLGLRRLHAQHRLVVTIKNTGAISAEGVSLEIRSGNTTLHSIPYYVLILGKTAPQPRPFRDHLRNMGIGDLRSPHRNEPFTFYNEEGGPGRILSWSCASFRQEKTFRVEVSVEVLEGTGATAQIEAVVTAQNLKGDVRSQLLLPISDEALRFDQAFDLESMQLRAALAYDALDYAKKDDQVRWFHNNGSKARSD